MAEMKESGKLLMQKMLLLQHPTETDRAKENHKTFNRVTVAKAALPL